MNPTLSLVVVTFNSSEVLPDCLSSFRRECVAGDFNAEVVIVDHSDDRQEQARVAECDSDLLLQIPNQGYAAGLNRGLEKAVGDWVVLANPDLDFQAGSLPALVAATEQGWDLVGPQLTVGGVLIPGHEDQTLVGEWNRQRVRRNPRSLRRYLAAEASRGGRLWDAKTSVEVQSLSGCCILGRRDRVLGVGPWDEEFFLYFEETDWLRRARAQGLRLAQVPKARVEHRWGHSAHPGQQSRRFETSRARYYQRYYGRLGRWLIARSPPRPPCPLLLEGSAQTLAEPGRKWFVSASPWGFPAGRFEGTSCLETASRRFLKASPKGTQTVVWALRDDREVLGPHVLTENDR